MKKPQEIPATFDDPWPEVLFAMHEWLRTQALQAGAVERMAVVISLSRASLLAAKAQGNNVQPAFDQFRKAIWDEWQIDIPLPDKQRGLHEQGPHRITFYYWR